MSRKQPTERLQVDQNLRGSTLSFERYGNIWFTTMDHDVEGLEPQVAGHYTLTPDRVERMIDHLRHIRSTMEDE